MTACPGWCREADAHGDHYSQAERVEVAQEPINPGSIRMIIGWEAESVPTLQIIVGTDSSSAWVDLTLGEATQLAERLELLVNAWEAA